MDAQPLRPSKMFKYGTFSNLFGGGGKKEGVAGEQQQQQQGASTTASSSATEDQDASPTAAAAPATAATPSKLSANKKCVRISLIVMLSSGVILAVGLLAGLLTNRAEGSSPSGSPSTGNNTRPNIIMIMTDDQDRRLGSTDYQTSLHRELINKGTEFTNHYTTQALCCPARSSFLRGQQIRTLDHTVESCPSVCWDAKIG